MTFHPQNTAARGSSMGLSPNACRLRHAFVTFLSRGRVSRVPPARKDERMELYQAEWCPHSHKVRQRLTELGLDVTLRQVPADPEARDEMERAVGTRSIPVLVTDDGETLRGDDEILDHLDGFEERDDADEHRAKARAEVPTFVEVAG